MEEAWFWGVRVGFGGREGALGSALIYGSFHNDFHWSFAHDLLKIGEFFGHHVNLREILSKIGYMVYPIFLIQTLLNFKFVRSVQC